MKLPAILKKGVHLRKNFGFYRAVFAPGGISCPIPGVRVSLSVKNLFSCPGF